MNPAFDLNGRLVLITGGGTGLGRAMAEAVVRSGGSAVITGAHARDSGGRLRRAWAARALYRQRHPKPATASPRFWTRCEARFGALYGAISNAGNHLKKPALKTVTRNFSR